MTAGGHSGDTDPLPAEGLGDAIAGGVGIGADGVQLADVLAKPGHPFRSRVDGAGDARLQRLRGGAQGHQQVVQEHHRPAGGHPHEIAAAVDRPAFARSGQHDVVLIGVDEHVVDVLQAGQVLHGVGERFTLLEGLPDRPLQANQGNFPLGEAIEISGNLLQDLQSLLGELAAFVFFGIPQQTVGADGDAAHRLLKDLGMDLGIGGRQQPDRQGGDRNGRGAHGKQRARNP